MATNQAVKLVSRPQGRASTDNLRIESAPMPEPAEGEFRVRVTHVSLDPAMRGWMNEDPVYVPPIPLGETMRAYAAGEVETSRHPDFEEGQAVVGMFGVQRYALSDGRGVIKADASVAPLPRWLGGLGMPGVTAYLGVTKILEPKEGDVLVASAASGAVGSVVGQVAKRLGCRTIGIAGGPEKVERLSEYGYDAGIDYKAGDVAAQLKGHAGDGVDLYYENVGGPVGNAVLHQMRPFGRVALCGLIARYNETNPDAGGYDARATASMLVNRLKVQGFIVLDFAPQEYATAVRTLASWHAEGSLTLNEDVREGGVEAYVDTLNLLYSGGNHGKLVLAL